ncbi:MAG: sulfatase [Planctomycetes bacterium]|nr:sulfatase [Planctomycetota bacterium]
MRRSKDIIMVDPDISQSAGQHLSISRRDFVKQAGAVVAGSALGWGLGCHVSAPISTRLKRPNLLFVYADQMREMAMSCSGNPNLSTPNMDRLAAEGVRFSRMYTPSPLCSPARSSLMTGLYPHNAGVSNNNMRLRDDVRCIAEITSAAGYKTGHIGKWHLYGNFSPGRLAEYAFVPPEHHRGFQYWAGFEHGHKYFQSRYYTDSDTPIQLPPGAYEPDVQTDLAIKFIENNAAVPWHLDLSWGPPHFPLEQVKPEDLARHKPENIELRLNVPTRFHQQARRDLCYYYAMIENLDWNLGRLLNTLDKLGLSQDVIVVFMADHGDMMLSHGQHYKRRPQEESSRVPFIIRYPGTIGGGRICEDMSSLVDVVPTIVELMKLDVSEFDGVSLAAWLQERNRYPRHKCIFMECPKLGCRDYDPGLFAKSPWRAVRTDTHKAAFLKTDQSHAKLVQLFDLSADPFEMKNLAESPRHRRISRQLAQHLTDWIRRTSDKDFAELRFVE